MAYCYVVYEDNVEVHTSKLFDTPEAAMKYFMEEDVPTHYKNETFYRGELSSFLTNSKYGPKFTKGKYIKIIFAEVQLNNLRFNTWEKIANSFPIKNV